MSRFSSKCAVVPIDFSDESFEAVNTALTITNSPDAVFLVHVLPELHPSTPGAVWGMVSDQDRIHDATEELAQRITDFPTSADHIYIKIGDPGKEIVHVAEQLKADLIVMPSHGRRGLSRMMLGSVAERVLRLAHCPVLVLRN